MTAAELKSTVGHVEHAPLKKLAQPDRANRWKKQQARLTSLRIGGEWEPSDHSIDRFANFCEENCLTYVELSRCTSKGQEVLNTSQKEDKHMTMNPPGSVKLRASWRLTCPVT